jgi:hypothetical protein
LSPGSTLERRGERSGSFFEDSRRVGCDQHSPTDRRVPIDPSGKPALNEIRFLATGNRAATTAISSSPGARGVARSIRRSADQSIARLDKRDFRAKRPSKSFQIHSIEQMN